MLISNHKYVYFLIFYYCKISVDAAGVANKVSYNDSVAVIVQNAAKMEKETELSCNDVGIRMV